MSKFQLTEGTFTVTDRLSLHYKHYFNPDAADTLILLHGHGEHSGRYQKFTQYLKDSKLNLALLDMRGCGLSEGEHCYVSSYAEYISDFSEFVRLLENRHGLKKQFFLFGHSNGALVSVHWALQNKDRIKSLFMSSPFLGLKLPAPLVILVQFLSRVAPHFVFKNPVYPPYLTHNPDEVDYYKRDLLIHRKITPRLLSEMLHYQHLLDRIPLIEFPFPVSILMSGLDKIVDPLKTKHFYERLKAPYKNLEVFEGLYHEIFNELGQEKVFEALIAQIEVCRALAHGNASNRNS